MPSITQTVGTALVIVLVAAGFASTSAADGWSGKYRLEGVNPNGSDYAGTVQIEQRGDGFVVRWLVDGRRYTGQGIARNRSLAVGAGEWVVIYEKADDGSLVGVWLPAGKYKAGSERLVPASKR